jgi:hypothetical protein
MDSNEHAAFAREVEVSQRQDPMPAFEGLSKLTGIPIKLFARKQEDWPTVAGIIDWSQAGTSSYRQPSLTRPASPLAVSGPASGQPSDP